MENRACSRANFWILGLGGVGWEKKTFMRLAYTRDATLLLRQWLGVGWGGVGYKRSCDLRARHVMLWNVCSRPTSMVAKASWWQTVPHATLNYPKLTSENNLIHESCNHSKGIFCIKETKKWGFLLVRTSGIDGMRNISQGAVSSSWSTRKGGAVNPQLLQGIRIWQWRWHHGNCKDFLSLTGHALSKHLEKWDAQSKSKKQTPPQKHKTL